LPSVLNYSLENKYLGRNNLPCEHLHNGQKYQAIKKLLLSFIPS